MATTSRIIGPVIFDTSRGKAEIYGQFTPNGGGSSLDRGEPNSTLEYTLEIGRGNVYKKTVFTYRDASVGQMVADMASVLKDASQSYLQELGFQKK